MKKALFLILSLIMCLSFVACANNDNTIEQTVEENQTEEIPETKEVLTESEQNLVNYIIQIATEEFDESSNVRVLSIGDYQERSKNTVNSYSYGPDTVVVKFQGNSKDTDEANPCFRICLTTTKNEDASIKSMVSSLYKLRALESLQGGRISTINSYTDDMMDYEGEAGDYVELGRTTEIKIQTKEFDIKKVNLAIKEYWEGLGL